MNPRQAVILCIRAASVAIAAAALLEIARLPLLFPAAAAGDAGQAPIGAGVSAVILRAVVALLLWTFASRIGEALTAADDAGDAGPPAGASSRTRSSSSSPSTMPTSNTSPRSSRPATTSSG